jgi:hypothetical protein
MKSNVSILVVISILLTASSLTIYSPSTNSAVATSSGRGADGQSSEDLGKEEQGQEGRGSQATEQDSAAEEEEEEEETNGDTAGEVEGDPDVDQELLNELRGGDDIKGSGTAEGEESEDDLLSELRGGDTTKQAPVAISGENVYVVWWTNNTANRNDEVMFRASTDGGTIFGNKTNLSNTTGADSVDAMIDAEGGNIVITWWETKETASTPVMRVSNDNGETFGPIMNLATNGTIGEAAEGTEEEGE